MQVITISIDAAIERVGEYAVIYIRGFLLKVLAEASPRPMAESQLYEELRQMAFYARHCCRLIYRHPVNSNHLKLPSPSSSFVSVQIAS